MVTFWRCTFILAYFAKVLSMRCYQCLSYNEQACNAYRHITDCDKSQDMCIVLKSESFVSNENGVTKETIFQSSCASSRFGCQSYCRILTRSGEDNCKAACCTKDLCNDISSGNPLTSSWENSASLPRSSAILAKVVLLLFFNLFVVDRIS